MNQTPAERANAIAEKLANELSPHFDSEWRCIHPKEFRQAIVAEVTAALTIPANHIRTPESEPDMYWEHADPETAMSSPEEHPAWCEVEAGTVVKFQCARSMPHRYYKRVDVPNTDDWEIEEATAAEIVEYERKQAEVDAKWRAEIAAENAARQSRSTPTP